MTQTVLFCFLVSAGIMFIFIVPSYVGAFRAFRQRKLAEARAEIAECATLIQPLLASGKISCGSHSHDVTAMLVNRAQYVDKYVYYYAPWGAKRRRIKALVAQMHKELRRQPEEFQAIYRRFIIAMWKAARYRQPLKSAFIFTEILVRVLAEALMNKGANAFRDLKARAGDISTAACGVRLAPVRVS